jgi:predicted dehydrogenase
MSTPLRWGLLSTAAIGSTVVRAVQDSADSRFVAVASRDAERARGFADVLAVEQAATLDALRESAHSGAPATLTTGAGAAR